MSTSAEPSQLSQEAKFRASEYLRLTREKLLDCVSGLSEAQWRFKPAADQWSPAEIVEHVTIIETRIHGLIGRMGEAAEAEPGRDDAKADELIMTTVPVRGTKIAAPPLAMPTGQHSPEELLRRFEEARAHTHSLLETAPFLRGRVFPHPVLGSCDGYQWVLGVAAHTARHTAQILEVGQHPEFGC